MFTRTGSLVSAMILLSMIASVSMAADEYCRDVLIFSIRGETYRLNTATSVDDQFEHSIESKWYSSFDEEHENQAWLEVPERFAGSLGSSKVTGSEFERFFSEHTKLRLTTHEELAMFAQIANREAIRAWADCMQGNNRKTPLRASLNRIGGSNSYDLRLKFESNVPGVTQVLLNSVTFLNGTLFPTPTIGEILADGATKTFRFDVQARVLQPV